MRRLRSGSVANKPWVVLGISLLAMAVLVLLLSNPLNRRTPRGDLVLFCAAGLLKPAQEIATDYEQEYGVKVRIEPDASGTLLSKLRVAPARADLFLAGEEDYLRDARSLKLVDEIFPVVHQHLVIAVKGGNPLKIAGPADLLRPAVSVVLPNPETAAVGKAARKVLTQSGQWDALAARIRDAAGRVSLAGTVTEAAQAVKLGAADAAIVWDATARQFGVDLVEVPLFEQQAMEQATLGVIAASPRPTAALHFARYLTARDRGEVVFGKYYFQPLEDADVWENRPALVLMAGAMLKPAIDDVVNRFGQREGVDINTIYAGCGIHVAQMKAMKGGQVASSHFPDAYFSCDVSFMSKVQQWFDASVKISRNDMVLAVPKGNPKKVRSIEDLTRPELRVGLGHPTKSALGALSDDLLTKLKIRDKVHAVVEKSAGHELINDMRAGALDLILVYRSNVLSSAKGSANDLEIVEMNLPEAIAIQPFAVAKDSQHKYLMRRLLAAILSPETQKHFGEVGFRWIADEQSP